MFPSRSLTRAFALLVAAAVPSLALAQTPAPNPPPVAAPPPPVVAGFQDGFFVQSVNGENRLVFGMVAQTDGRFALGSPKPITNTFLLRKLRPTLSGRVGGFFDFKVMPDFGNGATVIQDAYFDMRFSPKFRLRTGKDKTPVGYELVQGDGYLFFPERALASSLVPNRDIGIQAQGDLSPKFFYTVGVFNGIPDGTSSTTEVDTNNGKDLAARIVIQPFRTATNPGPLNGFGVHLGGTAGTQTGALPSFKTSIQQTYFSYAPNTAASGPRNRISPAVFYYYKSFGAFGEYMQSTQRVAKTTTTIDATNRAWNVTGSFLVTGEAAAYGQVRVKKPFDPARKQWGALQILARYSALSVDRGVFDAGLAAANASREATQLTVAANWYPVSYIKWYVTFERTTFDAPASRPVENTFLFRAQLGF